MKTSIFNMTFTLPPMVEMTEVEKDMPTGSADRTTWALCCRDRALAL